MKLADYRSKAKISQRKMGLLIGKDDTTISKYESGDIKPSLDAISKIQQVTDGAVTVDDFIKGS